MSRGYPENFAQKIYNELVTNSNKVPKMACFATKMSVGRVTIKVEQKKWEINENEPNPSWKANPQVRTLWQKCWLRCDNENRWQ